MIDGDDTRLRDNASNDTNDSVESHPTEKSADGKEGVRSARDAMDDDQDWLLAAETDVSLVETRIRVPFLPSLPRN